MNDNDNLYTVYWYSTRQAARQREDYGGELRTVETPSGPREYTECHLFGTRDSREATYAPADSAEVYRCEGEYKGIKIPESIRQGWLRSTDGEWLGRDV